MKYTEPGTYQLEYTAVDECGNETTQTREVTVEPSATFTITGGAENIRMGEGSTEEVISTPTSTGDLPTEYTDVRLQITNLVIDGTSYGDVDATTNWAYVADSTYHVWIPHEIKELLFFRFFVNGGVVGGAQLTDESGAGVSISWDNYRIEG